jgi:hypothetical protein
VPIIRIRAVAMVAPAINNEETNLIEDTGLWSGQIVLKYKRIASLEGW